MSSTFSYSHVKRSCRVVPDGIASVELEVLVELEVVLLAFPTTTATAVEEVAAAEVALVTAATEVEEAAEETTATADEVATEAAEDTAAEVATAALVTAAY